MFHKNFCSTFPTQRTTTIFQFTIYEHNLFFRDFWITRKTLCHQINKKLKKLFSKVLALRALFCHCQEYGRKYSFTIFLPTSTHILTNIKTFKKQKHEKQRR